jgi:hypothetical protein
LSILSIEIVVDLIPLRDPRLAPVTERGVKLYKNVFILEMFLHIVVKDGDAIQMSGFDVVPPLDRGWLGGTLSCSLSLLFLLFLDLFFSLDLLGLLAFLLLFLNLFRRLGSVRSDLDVRLVVFKSSFDAWFNFRIKGRFDCRFRLL